MPNLHDLILDYIYRFPDAFVAFFLCAIGASLAPILVAEALALFRGLHQARHWRWRDALALVPLLAAVANLALASVLWKLYHTLSGYYLGVVEACRRHMYICRDLFPPAAVREASGDVERLVIPALLWLLAVYILALVGLAALGSRRRRHRAPALAVR